MKLSSLQRTCNVGERIEGRAANTSQPSLRQERPRAKEGGRRRSLQDGLHWPHNHPNRAEFLPVSVYSYISPGRGSCSQSISALNYGQSKMSKIQRIGLQKKHPFIQLQSSPNLLYVYAKSPRRQQEGHWLATVSSARKANGLCDETILRGEQDFPSDHSNIVAETVSSLH